MITRLSARIIIKFLRIWHKKRLVKTSLFLAPPVGLEPTTTRLTAVGSTDWAKEEYYSPACVQALRRSAFLVFRRAFGGFVVSYGRFALLLPFAFARLRYEIRQWPNLPGRVQPSTFGAVELNFCVRDGNRWILNAITTGNGIYHWLLSVNIRFALSQLHI